MGALSAAVQQERWEVAAYLLLIGLAKVASRVPPETLAELMALLQEADALGPAPASPPDPQTRGAQ